MPEAKLPLSSSVESGVLPRKLYAIGAEFAGPKELFHAAEKVRDKGYKNWDCYSPYYIHGMDQAMGQGKSFVNLFTFFGGLGGLVGAFLLIVISSVYVYPLDTQGKPAFSLPGFVPILDLVMILASAFVTLFGMIGLNGMPRLQHPLWDWEAFTRATHDKFFIVIEVFDPKFSEKGAIDALREAGGTNLTYIGEDE